MGDEIDIQAEQTRLQAMPMAELKREFLKAFGWQHSTHNRSTLVRRILWRRQYGPLSPETVARAREIAQVVMVREIAPRGWPESAAEITALVKSPARDGRLPAPGTLLSREYQGREVLVTVGEDDFEYEGERYTSLSAIARKVTGTAWNGLLFFGLTQRKRT
jgi:hypothetical protein